ncbi:MAG TPA: hypothetical protein VJ783_13730 [Pirellulales bacterium]|nr:hypothetical protein [Pirellulales bacterium]
MSCKFTGWLAPLPFIAYAVVYGDRQTAKILAIGLSVALAVFWIANPRLWHHPFGGLLTFFDLNLNRAGTRLEIPTLFFGRRYDMQTPLPWYNTLVWTAITVPLGILGLGLVGMVSLVPRWAIEPAGILILLNWLVLIVVRALPGTPVHDAERLILPSFAFFAALAGVGAARVVEWRWGTSPRGSPGPCGRLLGVWRRQREPGEPECRAQGPGLQPQATQGRAQGPGLQPQATRGRARGPGLQRGVAIAAVAIAYLGAAASTVWYAPQWLSYYSPIIGGLQGADAAGMEATYYWDALDAEVLDWLHEHTRDDETIEFASGSMENLTLMRRWGVLRRDVARRGTERHGVRSPQSCRWYVLQRRPTFWTPQDRWLVEHERPAFSKTIRPPSWGFGPWRLDVPLILVYSPEQRDRAAAAVHGGNGGVSATERRSYVMLHAARVETFWRGASRVMWDSRSLEMWDSRPRLSSVAFGDRDPAEGGWATWVLLTQPRRLGHMSFC